jgi:hypothetical protein
MLGWLTGIQQLQLQLQLQLQQQLQQQLHPRHTKHPWFSVAVAVVVAVQSP